MLFWLSPRFCMRRTSSNPSLWSLWHSPWMIYFNESHTARIRFATSRWCGIRRIKIEAYICLGMLAFLSKHSLLFLCDSLLTHKKSTTPGNLMSETVPACASRGSNPAHPESPSAFYISLLNIILYYKNARNSFVYRALRAI